MNLSDKQLRFCQEYTVDRNATQAAIRAGYSKRSARNQANRLMTNDDIKKHIHELHSRQEKRIKVSSDNILEELSKVALTQLPVSEMKWSDKMKALELMGKYFNLLSGTNRDTTKDMSAIRERLFQAVQSIQN